MKSLIFFKNTQLKPSLVLVAGLSLGFISCRSTDNVTDTVSGGKAIVKVNLLRTETEDDKPVKIGASNQMAASPEVQRQNIAFDDKHSFEVTFSPASAVNKLAAINPMAASPTPLNPGVMYKVVVYDTNGAYVDQKNFTYGVNDTSGFQLNGGQNYTFVAYSINSKTGVPDVDSPNSLANAGVVGATGDLMYFKTNMTVSGNQDNNLNVILKHRYSQITTILDATGIGNIMNASGVMTPTNTSANLKFANDQVLTYNGIDPNGASVTFSASELGKPTAKSDPTILISDTSLSGELNLNSLTIGSTTRNNIKVKNLKVNPGYRYDLTLKLDGALKPINILSLGYDSWTALLYDNSNGIYTSVARSKLNNPDNFGPNGTVRISGFQYDTVAIGSTSDALFMAAVDKADIIWIGYIDNTLLPVGSVKRNYLQQKIDEKKKFFFTANDNYNGFSFPGLNTFNDMLFGYYGYGTYQINVLPDKGPTTGIFGKVTADKQIQETYAVGKITNYPSDAVVFLTNPDGSANGLVKDNFLTVSDLAWYTNAYAQDGFYNGTNKCDDNHYSILFCNVFEMAINYIKNNR
ncbi:fimbrillin family protein [Elizabethkingia ursingii]|uniref:fimbrillin family protein n=1 Tax=Elizabethkingia ursingii TaxID=1756150 RepID=UPI002011480B|nr:fimbrillin family protein [Elizabethkingia ursingii]MCL1668562.1 fimbrillin family protein [Elizabethkingia ursingii]